MHTVSAKHISPNQDDFLYTGRVDFTSPERPYISWPGTSIKFNVASTKLIFELEDAKGQNFFNFIMDEQVIHVLALKKGKHRYDLSHLVSGNMQTFELFKRTEGHEGGTTFVGIELANDAEFGTKPKSILRKIVFYGDSVTSGMGNEASDYSDDNQANEKNHYLSYAAIASRALNAEHHAISLSGIGFMISWFDFTMPEYFDQLRADGNNQSKWRFDQWQPDVVVVNLGQNDSWILDQEQHQSVKQQDIEHAYMRFIQTLLIKHPDAQFICALGSMDVSSQPKWLNIVQQSIAKLNLKNPKANIEFIKFNYTGFKKHPRVRHHQTNAKLLSQFIQYVMKW